LGAAGLKIHTITVATMMILWAALGVAQDQSLGDVARESRARAQGTKPAKVLNEDESEARPVTASDDPAAVINKAVAAMAHDTSHRCRKLITGNAPGLPLSRTIEIAAVGRYRVSAEQGSRPLADLIMIGNDLYEKLGDGPWKKADEKDKAGFQLDLSGLVPDELKSSGGELKLIGPAAINGAATLQYQSTFRNSDVDRTTNLWIGAGDSLPRKIEMQTRYLKQNLSRDETTRLQLRGEHYDRATDVTASNRCSVTGLPGCTNFELPIFARRFSLTDFRGTAFGLRLGGNRKPLTTGHRLLPPL